MYRGVSFSRNECVGSSCRDDCTTVLYSTYLIENKCRWTDGWMDRWACVSTMRLSLYFQLQRFDRTSRKNKPWLDWLLQRSVFVNIDIDSTSRSRTERFLVENRTTTTPNPLWEGAIYSNPTFCAQAPSIRCSPNARGLLFLTPTVWYPSLAVICIWAVAVAVGGIGIHEAAHLPAVCWSFARTS